MSNFNLKLDLSKLDGFGEIKLTGKNGIPTDCIVIPKVRNNIFSSEKGGRYLDLVCFETPNSEYGSHFVTISKTKEEQEQEKNTGERIRKPIVGNLKPFGTSSQNLDIEQYSISPSPSPSPSPATTIATMPVNPDDGDLPF